MEGRGETGSRVGLWQQWQRQADRNPRSLWSTQQVSRQPELHRTCLRRWGMAGHRCLCEEIENAYWCFLPKLNTLPFVCMHVQSSRSCHLEFNMYFVFKYGNVCRSVDNLQDLAFSTHPWGLGIWTEDCQVWWQVHLPTDPSLQLLQCMCVLLNDSLCSASTVGLKMSQEECIKLGRDGAHL